MRSRSKPTSCPSCGAPAEPSQELCLHCGAQLPRASRPEQGFEAALRRLLPWLPPAWIWPLVVLALITVGSVAVAFSARHERRAQMPSFIATSTEVTSAQTTTVAPSSPGTGSFTTVPRTTATPPTTPPPTISMRTLPVAPGAPSTTARTTPAPATTAKPATGGVGSWPSDRSGWTDILLSLPESEGRDAALAVARRAAHAGLTQVGILLSSRYSSLRAGYWVVYAGVYDSPTAAETGLAAAHDHGFAGAYPAKVSR